MSAFTREDGRGEIKLTSDRDITLEADRDMDGAGDIVFRTGGVERGRISAAGASSGWPTYADIAQKPSSDRGDAASRYSGVTYRRAAVSIRFDDGQLSDKNVVQPLLKARWLPAGFAIPAAYVGAVAGTIVDKANNGASVAGQMTAADLLALQADGHEIMCHTQTHDVAPTSYAGFVAETVTARTNLLGLGAYYVDNFVAPGPWQTGAGPYYFNQESKFLTQSASALKDAFNAADGYIFDGISDGTRNIYRKLPNTHPYGAGYLDGNSSSIATLQAVVDYCITAGVGVHITFHSFFFDTASNITTADFTTFLTYLQGKRDAGLLDVLTPTGLIFAQQSETKKNVIPGASFTEEAAGAAVWWTQTGTVAFGVGTGHGGSGSNLVEVDSANYVQHFGPGFGTRAWRFEVWCKSKLGGGVFPRAIVRVINNTDTFNYSSVDLKPGSTTGWTKVSFITGGNSAAAKIKVWLFAEAGSGVVQWSDPVLSKI